MGALVAFEFVRLAEADGIEVRHLQRLRCGCPQQRRGQTIAPEG